MGPSCWSGVRELEKEPRPAAAAKDSRIAAGDSPGSPLPETLEEACGAEGLKAFGAVSSGSSGVIDGVGAVDGRLSDGMGGVGAVGLSAGVALSVGMAPGLSVAFSAVAVPSAEGRRGDADVA